MELDDIDDPTVPEKISHWDDFNCKFETFNLVSEKTRSCLRSVYRCVFAKVLFVPTIARKSVLSVLSGICIRLCVCVCVNWESDARQERGLTEFGSAFYKAVGDRFASFSVSSCVVSIATHTTNRIVKPSFVFRSFKFSEVQRSIVSLPYLHTLCCVCVFTFSSHCMSRVFSVYN